MPKTPKQSRTYYSLPFLRRSSREEKAIPILCWHGPEIGPRSNEAVPFTSHETTLRNVSAKKKRKREKEGRDERKGHYAMESRDSRVTHPVQIETAALNLDFLQRVYLDEKPWDCKGQWAVRARLAAQKSYWKSTQQISRKILPRCSLTFRISNLRWKIREKSGCNKKIIRRWKKETNHWRQWASGAKLLPEMEKQVHVCIT